MGCSVYGYAVVGLKVPWHKVCKGTKKSKRFEHNHPEDWEVDPKTGKRLWYEENVFIDGWEGDYAGDEFLAGYEVVRDSEDPDFALICLGIARTGDLLEGWCDPRRISLPSTPEVEKFADKMDSLGLWDPDEFGVFSYGYASC